MFSKLFSIKILLAAVLFFSVDTKAQDTPDTTIAEFYNHSLEFTPMSPFVNIYALQYQYRFNETSELILGLIYMSIPYENIGRSHAPGIYTGYRYNFGKGWHAEYSVYPMYDNFWESNERKYYNSFDLWNEFRFGYQYDFTISNLPVFVKAQVPFGFIIYSENKPQSFKNKANEGDNKFFYQAVFLYFGIMF